LTLKKIGDITFTHILGLQKNLERITRGKDLRGKTGMGEIIGIWYSSRTWVKEQRENSTQANFEPRKETRVGNNEKIGFWGDWTETFLVAGRKTKKGKRESMNRGKKEGGNDLKAFTAVLGVDRAGARRHMRKYEDRRRLYGKALRRERGEDEYRQKCGEETIQVYSYVMTYVESVRERTH